MRLRKSNAKRLQQCAVLWYYRVVTQSTITDRFQTTIPLEVRVALKLKPRQRVSYELRADGSAVLRPEPELDELFASVKLKRPVASTRAEKKAAREAMARESGSKGLK
jgi:bifunctional DNA-binding transcriptional regulator/antitoxin component of YhaV-PrlF toxin-antitoxin module